MIQEEAFRCKTITASCSNSAGAASRRREEADLGELIQVVLTWCSTAEL